MTYAAGDTFKVVSADFPGSFYAEGEQVVVLEVGDDGVPVVGTVPHDLDPVGRNMRLVPELEVHFEPA